MSRIIVIANLTSIRVFEIDSVYSDKDNNLATSSGISEIENKKSEICSSWSLEDYIDELVGMVNTTVLQMTPDSWLFAIPFNLTRQVVPRLDPLAGARLEEVLLEDLSTVPIDRILSYIPSLAERRPTGDT